MRTVNNYLDAAIKRQNLKNDAGLSRLLGISTAALSAFRRGIAFPTDENMVNIATLAGIDAQVALIELSFLRAKGEAKNTYEKILRRISTFLPATLLGLYCLAPNDAFANTFKALSHLPDHAGSVSHYANIMYITETNTENTFLNIERKQIFNKFSLSCVSEQKKGYYHENRRSGIYDRTRNFAA